MDLQIAESFSNERLELFVLPTEKCNFRCIYCYEDFEIGRMSERTICALERFLSKKIPLLKNLKISWFGGEPLLALDIIERINSYTLSQVSNHPKLKFTSEITTNGYLLSKDVAEKLLNLEVRTYQISIDGPKDFHDRTRIKANGSGTFQKIWKNLITLQQSNFNFNITIRLHITEENFQSCISFIEELKKSFLFDMRFNLFVKSVGKYGGKNDEKINPLSKIHEHYINSLIGNGYTEYQNLETNICYASKPNSFVLRANGKINKCTVALNNPVNFVGELLDDGSMYINPNLAFKWSKGFFDQDIDYLGCPLSKISPQL